MQQMHEQTRLPHYAFVYAPIHRRKKSKLTDPRVIFKAIAAANIKTAVWKFTPCSLVDIYRCFEGTGCLHL